MAIPTEGVWNAWRYPNDAEIAAGVDEFDMIFVGSSTSDSEACKMLPKYPDGSGRQGQIQWGISGKVVFP